MTSVPRRLRSDELNVERWWSLKFIMPRDGLISNLVKALEGLIRDDDTDQFNIPVDTVLGLLRTVLAKRCVYLRCRSPAWRRTADRDF